jgi:hypothetical protein
MKIMMISMVALKMPDLSPPSFPAIGRKSGSQRQHTSRSAKQPLIEAKAAGATWLRCD